MKQHPKIALVFNDKASRATEHKDAILAFCNENSITVHCNSDHDDFKAAFSKALDAEPDRLIIAGGDGTIVGGIEAAQERNHHGSYGIIPIGTANYFARNCSISLEVPTALQQALSNETTAAHLGKANDSLFALTAAVGVGAAVSERTTRARKKRYGQAAYIVTTLELLKKHDPVACTITIDETEVISGKSHLVVITNAQLSDTLPLAPDIAIDTPRFKLVYYTSTSSLGLLLNILLYIISFGRLQRGYKERDCSLVGLETDPSVSIALDGDIREQTPAKITILEQSVAIAH